MDTIDTFKERITKTAEDFVYNIFPNKAKQMDTMLYKEEFLLTGLDRLKKISEDSLSLPLTLQPEEGVRSKRTKIHKDTGDSGETSTVIRKETVLANKEITSLIDVIRPELIILMEACNTIRVWVTLLLPKMEDGNNFGVSVQEEIMAEIKAVEGEAASFLEQLSSYHLARAKVSSKLVKYPNISDYAKYVVEEDEKQFVNLRHVVAELRNFYTSLHDLIDKNIDKIKKPRNENHNQMY